MTQAHTLVRSPDLLFHSIMYLFIQNEYRVRTEQTIKQFLRSGRLHPSARHEREYLLPLISYVKGDQTQFTRREQGQPRGRSTEPEA